jgi:hypothetical protein
MSPQLQKSDPLWALLFLLLKWVDCWRIVTQTASKFQFAKPAEDEPEKRGHQKRIVDFIAQYIGTIETYDHSAHIGACLHLVSPPVPCNASVAVLMHIIFAR